MKQPTTKLWIALSIACLVGMGAAGCNAKTAGVTKEEKKNWAGTAPPPGFDKEIEKQNREWQERDAKARAKLGQPSNAPAGVKL